MNKTDRELIQIAYNSLKAKFDILYNSFENYSIDSKNKKIRILFIDLTFIYNFLFGFFINNKSEDLIFNLKYMNIHIVEILNLIAHYRHFFHSKLKCDNDYIFIFKTPNVKQQKEIYKNIFKNLEYFSQYIPNLFVSEGLNKSRQFFKEIINQEFKINYKPYDDIKGYIFSTDDGLKSSIYSFLNEYFENDNLLVDMYYKHNKIYANFFENRYPEYQDLFYNKDKIIRKKFRNEFYKFILLQLFSPKLHRLRKKTKNEILNNIYVNKYYLYQNIVNEKEYEQYLNVLTLIHSENEQFKVLVSKILNSKKIDLFDKNIYNLNQKFKTEFENINIEWLLKI